MRAALSRLQAGDWVHLFPEGTRSRDPGRMGPVRKGVGWLVASCDRPPLVLPYAHAGMEEVLPKGALAPRIGAPQPQGDSSIRLPGTWDSRPLRPLVGLPSFPARPGPVISRPPHAHAHRAAAGKSLRILVGEPVAVDDLMAAARAHGWPEARLHQAIAERVGQVHRRCCCCFSATLGLLFSRRP
jgi:monolysocardiolipin acyltransferase